MVMQELEALGKERTKKTYISNGAHEPLFGVATGAMKPLSKKIKKHQPLADQLYATGNYVLQIQQIFQESSQNIN